MGDENIVDLVALGIAGLKVASVGAKVLNAVGGTKGLASVGLKHCSHCKGTQGPCQCAFGCPLPSNALRKSQCFPIHKGTSCDSCGTQNFPGSRFKCQLCPDFDLCQYCYEGGRHDNTHPFFHIAALGRLPELLQPQRDTPVTPPILAPSCNQHHSSVSSSTSIAAPTSSMPNVTAAVVAASSSLPMLRHQHTGIRCDYCGTENLQGNRFKCQTCDAFDLCQFCFENHSHDPRHSFLLIAREGATPIALAKPHNGHSQAATSSPFQANPYREPQSYSSDVHHQTFTALLPTLPFAPHINGGKLSEVDDPDSTTPYLMESITSFSSSSFSSSQPHQRLNQQTADSSSLLDMSSTSLKASQPSNLMPYVPPCWQTSDGMNAKPKPSALQNDIGNTATTSLSSRQSAGTAISVLHRNVFCDGPRCRGATQCIVGPRYTCAHCPPSIDLCEACYTSKSAHNISHAFKRFDQADALTYITCPPQQQQQELYHHHQQQQQTRQEHHPNVFCDGPRCREATQCIVGPRYTCANCPPSFDVCHTCYTSKTAHDISHSFKRFDKAGQATYVWCPPLMQQQPQPQQPRQEQHVNVFCDGPRCRGATQCIVGPRYSCANCPPSIDLCQSCYTSKAAHNISHSFKRFDNAGLLMYVLCPPQMQMQQQQTRQEQHPNVFCDGPRCREATQCIVGPRYTCANCPPSVDLCHPCFSSQSAHNPSHSFKRFDKAGLSLFVMCSPLSQEGPRPALRLSQQGSTGPGRSQIGPAPPNRPPTTNAANQGEGDPPDRFQQVLETGIEILENEQSEREREELDAQILEQLQQNQQDALEYQNALLAYQQQMQNQQQEAVSTEQYYDNSCQYTQGVQGYEVNVQEYEFSFDF